MIDDMELRKLTNLVDIFCEERDWTQFHNVKDLAIGISIESAELLQIFLWKSPEEINNLMGNPLKMENIEDEMSDILFYLIRMASLNNINLGDSLRNKIKKNDAKYPVSKFKGSNKKYNEN
jgi:NTP pyrophosphatase (non-canonical NTP hydrolase)